MERKLSAIWKSKRILNPGLIQGFIHCNEKGRRKVKPFLFEMFIRRLSRSEGRGNFRRAIF
jgi:hypothetical protein